MIDCENEVYTRLAKVLREKFPKIDIASEYVKSPSSFPHVSITQSDSYVPIAELLNGAMEEIDFTYLGGTVARLWTSFFDLVIGVLGGLDWGLVGKSIGDYFKGAFNEAQEWIASYDWNKMGKNLRKNLKACVTGIDFAGVAKSFFKMLGSALAAAVSFIAGFVSGIWEDITGYFSKYLTNDDGTKKCGLDWVAGLLEGIWDGIKNIGKWIKENVFDPFIEGFKECFGILTNPTPSCYNTFSVVASAGR